MKTLKKKNLLSVKIRKNRKKWKRGIQTIWKIFSFLLWILGIIFAIFFFFQAYFIGKNFFQNIENISQDNKKLSSEIENIQEKFFTICSNQNQTRKMLLLPPLLCNTQGNEEKNFEQYFSLESDILTFFQLSYLPENNKSDTPLSEKFFAEDEKNTINQYIISKEKVSEQKKSWENFFSETSPDENSPTEMFAYMQTYGVTITKKNRSEVEKFKNEENSEKREKKFFLLKKENFPDREIYWDETKKSVVAKENNSEKIISGITERYKEFEKKNQEKISTTELSAIENQKISASDNEKIKIYLIVGTNEGNTDTIILAFFDSTREKITMISLPRDIWYAGKKINRIRPLLGHNAFIQAIEKITQQKISGYIIISMEAFPQVIDSMGGIDFVFSRALIDPSYKTIDNGKKGTLFFTIGKHHLSGTQALRVVRSRHTTNDFSRAERQQKLIQSVRESLKEKNFSQLLSLTRIIIKNTQTNISPFEIVQLYISSKKYQIKTGDVMSTKNILEEKMLDVGGKIKAYILLPRKNDWSLIPKFIQKKLEEK